jgi:hypothetical protein
MMLQDEAYSTQSKPAYRSTILYNVTREYQIASAGLLCLIQSCCKILQHKIKKQDIHLFTISKESLREIIR